MQYLASRLVYPVSATVVSALSGRCWEALLSAVQPWQVGLCYEALDQNGRGALELHEFEVQPICACDTHETQLWHVLQTRSSRLVSALITRCACVLHGVHMCS